MNETCERCKNYQYNRKVDGDDSGRCRRYPPTADADFARECDGDGFDTPLAWEWPRVWADSWCGEFNPLDEEREA